MSFEDLPNRWSDAPITQSNICDVFDLFISYEDRLRGSIFFLVLDQDEHLLQPIAINDVPHDTSEPPWSFLDHLRDVLDEMGGYVMFARGRIGSPSLTASDLRWQQWVAETFGGRLLGCLLATDDQVTTYEQCDLSHGLAS